MKILLMQDSNSCNIKEDSEITKKKKNGKLKLMFISYLNMNNISKSEIKWKFQDNDNIG